MRTLLVSALLLACLPGGVGAQGGADPCEEPRNQHEMNECAAREFARGDSILNAVYQQVMEEMDPERAPLFRQAQREWVQLRDAECAFERAEFEGGSMAPMIHGYCMAFQTRERTAYLRRVLPDSYAARQRSDVVQAAHRLFDAMRDRDTVALRGLTHPRAMVTAVAPGDDVQVRTGEEFIRTVAQSRQVLREEIRDARVEIDDDLATLWAPYDFYRDDHFSHCGTDAFQFVRQDGAWKLLAITYTRRTTGCDTPQP